MEAGLGALPAIAAAVALMLAGIAVCAWADAWDACREQCLRVKSSVEETRQRRLGVGLAVCFMVGVFGAMFKFALIVGLLASRSKSARCGFHN